MQKIHCKECEVELSFMNIRGLKDLDFSRMGAYCSTCFPATEENLKQQRFVEEYDGNKIYSKDGKYSPYWHCWYCFDTVEEARSRIDAKGIGVYNSSLFN